MKSVEVYLSTRKLQYAVKIGEDIISNIPEMIDLTKYSSVYIITDSNVAKHYLPNVKTIVQHDNQSVHSYIFEAGEKSKQLSVVESIYNDLAKKKIDRKALIINLGGGVVTDLGGYVASTYLRGISFVNISTTLEGMVDASVGGKTGVNLGELKNYVGVFSQPKLVIGDISTLKTLPDRVFLQGYAEVIKHGLIADKKYFEKATEKNPLEMSEEEILEIITRSIEIKAMIVQEDEVERAARKLLNFGHTIGHVVESLSMNSENPLFHGEAVAIGMVAEAYISQVTGMIDETEFEYIERRIEKVGLPTRFARDTAVEDILNRLITDKKVESGKIKWSLLMGVGIGEFNVSVADKYVREAIEYIVK